MPQNANLAAHLDTNAALRYLWNDDPEASPPATRLIETAPRGSLHLSEIVIAEVVWSMHKKFTRAEIVDALERLIGNESVVVDTAMSSAVLNYAITNLDFADCLLAARSYASQLPVITYDRGFKKFRDITAQTPADWLAANTR